MLENLTFYLILVIITVLLVMLAKKIKVAYPVLLVWPVWASVSFPARLQFI
jgi:pheromone shutdown protein TraB